MKLAEIANRIHAHLRRFEADPKINVSESGKPTGARKYFCTNAYSAGGRVFVIYVTYQGRNSLTKAQALAYLAWLDAGNVGKHYRVPEARR